MLKENKQTFILTGKKKKNGEGGGGGVGGFTPMRNFWISITKIILTNYLKFIDMFYYQK